MFDISCNMIDLLDVRFDSAIKHCAMQLMNDLQQVRFGSAAQYAESRDTHLRAPVGGGTTVAVEVDYGFSNDPMSLVEKLLPILVEHNGKFLLSNEKRCIFVKDTGCWADVGGWGGGGGGRGRGGGGHLCKRNIEHGVTMNQLLC